MRVRERQVPSGRRAFLGGALALVAGLAQPAHADSRKARIGVLAHVAPLKTPFWKPFFTALRKQGWREGTEFSLELREALGDAARMRAHAKDLLDARVDVVLAAGTAAAVAMRGASNQVPIVAWTGYPVEAGLASSLARPGGNVTGVASYASAGVWGKFVELLRDLKPGLRSLGVLWDYVPPGFPDGLVPLPEIEEGAGRLGLASRVWTERTQADLAAALQAIERDRVEALIVTHGGGVHLRPEGTGRIVAAIERLRLPAITDLAYFQNAPFGCTLAYSPNVTEILGRLASLVDRVLRGGHPAEMPFELPSRFDLAVYAKAAQAIGLEVPQSILLRADRVVE